MTANDAHNLSTAAPGALRLDPTKLERTYEIIDAHIADGFIRGARSACATRQAAFFRCFGQASVTRHVPSVKDLSPLFPNTKVITAAAVWTLVERGSSTFPTGSVSTSAVSKRTANVTLVAHLLTHQAGFPAADVPGRASRIATAPPHGLRFRRNGRGSD